MMADEQPTGRSTAPTFQVRVPLEWADADDIPIVYANQVLVSHGGPEFFIVFGVVVPPTSPDQIPDMYRIQPQVRLVISREAMPAIVQALSDNLARYRAALIQGPDDVTPSST
jgi:hypothetical protein